MDTKMKIVNSSTLENNAATEAVAETYHANSLAWNDIVIYKEMADHTSVSMNLIQHIQNQMSQLQEMTARRQFLTKEIMGYIVK